MTEHKEKLRTDRGELFAFELYSFVKLAIILCCLAAELIRTAV